MSWVFTHFRKSFICYLVHMYNKHLDTHKKNHCLTKKEKDQMQTSSFSPMYLLLPALAATAWRQGAHTSCPQAPHRCGISVPTRQTQSTTQHKLVCNADSTVLAQWRKLARDWLVQYLGFFCLTFCYFAQQPEQIIFTASGFIHTLHGRISANFQTDENKVF